MAPKKKKKDNDPEVQSKPLFDPEDAFPPIDKEFYEIQVEDLNRKIAKLRSKCSVLEDENEDVKKKFKKLDEDRADIIDFLKRTLKSREDEIIKLNEKIKSSIQEKEIENNALLEKIKSMEKQFAEMHEYHTAEYKMLAGKLNDLRDFKAMREKLMDKLKNQEKAMTDQENILKKTLYEIEKEHMIFKHQLIQEEEARIKKLALDFQKTTKQSIAATTQNVIEENITINREMEIITESCKKLYEENEKLRKSKRVLQAERDVSLKQAIYVLSNNVIQGQLIERLNFEHKKIFGVQAHWTRREMLLKMLLNERSRLERENDDLEQKVQYLKAKLHTAMVESQDNMLCKLEAINHGYVLEEKLRETNRIVKEINRAQKLKTFGQSQDISAARGKSVDGYISELLALTNTMEIYQTPEPVEIPSNSTIATEDITATNFRKLQNENNSP